MKAARARGACNDFATRSVASLDEVEPELLDFVRSSVRWLDPGFPQTDGHPVTCVSFNDATAFCQWLGKKEGKIYRLPTDRYGFCRNMRKLAGQFDRKLGIQFVGEADAVMALCGSWSQSRKYRLIFVNGVLAVVISGSKDKLVRSIVSNA